MADAFALIGIKETINWTLLTILVDLKVASLALAFLSIPLAIRRALFLAYSSDSRVSFFADALVAIPFFIDRTLDADSSTVEVIPRITDTIITIPRRMFRAILNALLIVFEITLVALAVTLGIELRVFRAFADAGEGRVELVAGIADAVVVGATMAVGQTALALSP